MALVNGNNKSGKKCVNKIIGLCVSIVLAQVGGKWIADASTFDMNFKLWGGLMVLAAGVVLGVLVASPKSAKAEGTESN